MEEDIMRIAKIKNKYMYETNDDDNGTHYYLVYYDKKEKRYVAIQLTHLYIKDKGRFRQVQNGLIMVEKFKEFEVPSGVRKDVYYTNILGNRIDINDKKNVVKVYKRYIGKQQSDRIKQFVHKKKT